MELLGFKVNNDDISEVKERFFECAVVDNETVYYVYFIYRYHNEILQKFYVTDHSVFDKLNNIKVDDGRDEDGIEYLEAYSSLAATKTSAFYPFFRMMILTSALNGYSYETKNVFTDVRINTKCFYNSSSDYLYEGTADYLLDGKKYVSTVKFTHAEEDIFETRDDKGVLIEDSVVQDIDEYNRFRPVYARISDELYKEELKISGEKNLKPYIVTCTDDTCDWEFYNDFFDDKLSELLTSDEEDEQYYA